MKTDKARGNPKAVPFTFDDCVNLDLMAIDVMKNMSTMVVSVNVNVSAFFKLDINVRC
jgi:hypothetical protein